MQHNRAGRKLGRTTARGRAMFRNQLASLFTHERIATTLPKAKDLRPLAEKMVTLGKGGGVHPRRLEHRNRPDQGAVKRLCDTIAPRFAERAGGYSRIMKLGRRPGDGAEMAILELVDFDFAQRRAEKTVAEKAAADRKQSLLERAKRLVTGGKGGEKTEEKPEKVAEGEAAETPEAEPSAKKPPKKAAAPKTGKGPKPSAPKGGKKGSTARTPRKTGGA